MVSQILFKNRKTKEKKGTPHFLTSFLLHLHFANQQAKATTQIDKNKSTVFSELSCRLFTKE